MRRVTQDPPKIQSFVSSGQLKIVPIVKIETPCLLSCCCVSLGQMRKIQPCHKETYFENKDSLQLGSKDVVSVKDTGYGRQICSIWGGFCSFNIKLQKWLTKSRTGGFLHILGVVMEPCGHEVFLNVRIIIQHKKLCSNRYC